MIEWTSALITGPGIDPVAVDLRPDQLDVQIAMEMSAIRREVNLARRRLGLPPRDYGLFTPMQELIRQHGFQQQ